ncbi:MAG: chemotaxis protein CheB, partial [Polyangiaceae bacterium]
PIVIVSAGIDLREVEISVHALRAGALTVIEKPVGPAAADFEEGRRRFLATVKAMAQVKVVRHWPLRTGSELPGTEPRTNSTGQARIVALAASTGGPSALCEVLASLPGDFPLPVLVVQHIARGFVPGFASLLTTHVSLRAKVAEPGEPLEPRTIYVAPDDSHMGLKDARTVLVSSAPALGGFRPSASFLFESVAGVFGKSTLAVVLTGMGQDGLEGLQAVRRAGGQIIAQDEATSVVFGMPGAAVAAGLADATLPLQSIGRHIARTAQARGGHGA